MQPFTMLTGTAIPFGQKNVDTDIIIPARFLKTITRDGLGKGAFSVLREDPANIFDQPRYRIQPRARALGARRSGHPRRRRAELRGHFRRKCV